MNNYYEKLLSVLIFIALNISLTAQSPAFSRQNSVVIPDSCKQAVEPDTTFYPVINENPVIKVENEEMPLFPGGDQAFVDFIKKNTVYPDSALNDNLTGRVNLMFVIGPGGCPANFEVLEGRYEDLNNESLRVLKLLPKFKPGRKLKDSPKGRYWTNTSSPYLVIFNYQLEPAKPGTRGITILPPVNTNYSH